MTLRPLAELNRDLDFSPRRTWPGSLPAIAWQGQLLTGFDRTQGTVLELSDQDCPDLTTLLRELYPQLGVAEAARLGKRLGRCGLDATIAMRILGLREDPSWTALLSRIAELTARSQAWIDDKQVSPRELLPLTWSESPEVLSATIDRIAARNLTRSSGVRAVEMCAELLGMGKKLPAIEDTDRDGSRWLEKLWAERHPLAANADKERATAVAAIPWPAHMRAEWLRQGDEGRLEITLSVRSRSDWEKRIQEIERLRTSVSESTLWKI